MSERKLASIQRIVGIQSIDGADRIERADLLGWHCVVGRGEFKVGDLVVYLEVDAVTPQIDTYKLLAASNYRVKTRRFKKQVSQGLCLPLHCTLAEKYLPLCEKLGVSELPEGLDLTEILGIQKYEVQIPAQLQGQVKGSFPEFLFKTDEIRIQAEPQLLEKYADREFFVTEKIDGSSQSVYFHNNEFGVCSRNMDLKETEGNAYWKVARKLDLENKLKQLYSEYKEEFSFQGELAGMGVQSNKYKMSDLNFFVFNIFDITNGHYLGSEEMFKICERLGLPTVPQLGKITLGNFKTVDELVEFSKGKSALNKDVPREGIVLRPLVEEYSEDLRGRLSFKCINPDFLIKFDSE